MKNALRVYLKENFDFSGLKKIGAYPKEMKANDYEGQAKRICEIFNLESIYDYSKNEICCHLSMGDRQITVNEKGELESEPFVTVVFKNQMHI